MAQLIKLKDYISRYEWNAYRYPSHYIRLKQENWEKLYKLWNDRDYPEDKPETEPVSTMFSRFKSFIKRNKQSTEETEETNPLPSTEIDLRKYFLDKLYPFQLKWATSTITDVSFVDQGYETDQTLKYLLQRFPDIYLIMYYPVFNIKNAPIDGEIIMISPIGIEIIYLLEEDPRATFMASNERTWIMETGNEQTRRLSPTISLKRTEQIVKSILNAEDSNFPIKTTVLSRINNIVFSSEPYNINIIGKHQYERWLHKKRLLSSPLKSEQLKVITALLKHCLTNSVRRPEWEEDTNDFIDGG